AIHVNLIEHTRGPVTVELLFKLSEALEADLASFAAGDDGRLSSELAEGFGDALLAGYGVHGAELRELAAGSPALGRAVLALYRAWQSAQQDHRRIAGEPLRRAPDT